MLAAEAFKLISHALDSGKAAHGYLLSGDLRGECDVLTDMILKRLFPDEISQVEGRIHPDVAYLEPEGKSRTIHVKSMREKIVGPMSVTAFSGGWKVGVIVGADRMETEAANAFLKTLEEPPPKTLFILQTDAPDAILPTIISRSQRIDLPLSDGVLDGDRYEDVAEVLDGVVYESVFDRALAAKRLAEILQVLKDEAADEDFSLVRKAFFKTVMGFVRKGMLSGRVPFFKAFRNIEAVEAAYRQSEKSMNDEAVLSLMMDRIQFK